MKYSLIQLWPTVRASVFKLSFRAIKHVISHPSMDMARLGNYVQKSGPGGSNKDELLSEVDRQYGNISEESRESFIRNVIQKMVSERADLAADLNKELQKFGWNILSGNLIPSEFVAPLDLGFVPETSHMDMIKAAARIRDGDLSGAIGSACGAVDTLCAKLGGSKDDNFQKKVNDALEKSGRLQYLEDELKKLDWDDNIINQFIGNLKGAINQAAYVMQTLRFKMGDAHGTKEVLEPLVFDSIKWSMIICSLLKSDRK